jgi:hypothetical protein
MHRSCDFDMCANRDHLDKFEASGAQRSSLILELPRSMCLNIHRCDGCCNQTNVLRDDSMVLCLGLCFVANAL